jgi:hypothetical protein
MDDKDRGNPDQNKGGANGVFGEAVGIGAGGVLGAAMGAGLAGPVGMLVGGTLGTLAGAAAGYAIDYDSHEPEFRAHHETFQPQPQGRTRHTFEQASPAYRYGWEGHDNPEFQDHTYDKVRPALHEGWTGSSDFVDYEDYVKHGWERRAASKAAGSFSTAAKG